MNKQEIPTIDLKMETKEVKGKMIQTPYILVETPYITLSDKDGERKIWTKNKTKIILFYLWRVTGINWFVKKYNKLPR